MVTAPYLLIGHITADITPMGRVLGGTVSYGIPLAHAFGHSVRLLTSCAVAEPLINPLMSLADISVRLSSSTTTFENIYRGNQRSQIVHAIASSLDSDWIPRGWQSSSLVHLAPLVNDVDPCIAFHFPDATVLLTPQGLMRQWGADGVVRFRRWLDVEALESIDIVVMSKEDIAASPELEDEFARYCQCLIVTDGANGGTYYLNGKQYTYVSHAMIERYPTGAGDVFATTLLASLPYFAHDVHRAIKLAAHLSALAISRSQPQLILSQEQIHQVLALHQKNLT